MFEIKVELKILQMITADPLPVRVAAQLMVVSPHVVDMPNPNTPADMAISSALDK